MIQLTEDLYLSADKHQYILGTLVKKSREGEEYTELSNPQYFTTMPAAITAAVSRILLYQVKDGDITSLQGYRNELQKLTDDFNRKMLGH